MSPRLRVLNVIVAVFLFGSFAPINQAIAQVTTQSDSLESLSHSPRSALLKSALIPGWGQIYNEQKIKVPIVYAGLGTVSALAVYFNSRHTKYDQAYLFKVFEESEDIQYPQYESDYNSIAEGRNISAESLRLQRNSFRRNRDLSILSILAVYSFNLLDAYVNAHLVDFDINENLSLTPEIEGNVNVLSLKINF